MHSLGIQQQQRLREIGFSDLPISGTILLECLDIINTDKPSAELTGVLKKDPILYLRCIELLNDAQPYTPALVEEAQAKSNFLTNNPVHRLIHSTAVDSYFNEATETDESVYSRYRSEARHCALVAEALAKASGYPYPQEAYLAGLLHNLGQLIRLVRNKTDYQEMYSNASSNVELELFEKEWFGASSIEIAACLTEPLLEDSFLAESILFQYEMSQSLRNAPNLVRIVALAGQWINKNTNRKQLYQDIQLLLLIPSADCDKIEENTQQQLVIDNRGLDLVGKANEKNQDKVQLKLKQLTHKLAFEQSLQPSISDNEKELWNALIDNFHILFGYQSAVIFKNDHEKLSVQAVSRNTPNKLLQISLDANALDGSSIQQAIKQSSVVTRSQHAGSLNMIDVQLSRYLSCQQLLVVPLSDKHIVKAVLVAGMTAEPEQTSLDRERLVYFQQNGARILELINRTTNFSEDRFEQYKQQQSESIRKLVHESGNPLGVINNYIEVLKQSYPMDPKTNSQLDTIRKEINRVSRLLQKIRNIDTPTGPVSTEIDINRIIRSQVELLNDSLFKSNDIRCDLELEHGLAPLKLSSESLKQIILNLFKNSVEAIGNSGRILVRTQSRINFNGRLYTQLTIADNGPGIDPQVIEAAFSPIPTSKGESHSGLGLTIVSQLVQEMSGFISCQNLPSEGAEFRILLPASG